MVACHPSQGSVPGPPAQNVAISPHRSGIATCAAVLLVGRIHIPGLSPRIRTSGPRKTNTGQQTHEAPSKRRKIMKDPLITLNYTGGSNSTRIMHTAKIYNTLKKHRRPCKPLYQNISEQYRQQHHPHPFQFRKAISALPIVSIVGPFCCCLP